MTDFQTAMTLAGAIVLLAALVLIFQPRRPAPAVSAPEVATSARPGTTPEPASADELAQVRNAQAATDRRLGEVEHSLAQVRTMMGALPTKDAVNKLEVKITEVAGRVDLTHQIATRSSAQLDRIEDFLLKGGKA